MAMAMASCKDEAAATATGSGSADDEGSGRIVDVPAEVEGDGDGEGGTEGPVDAGASAEEGAGTGAGEEPQSQQQPDLDPDPEPPAAGGVEDRPPPSSTSAGDPVRTAEEGGIAASADQIAQFYEKTSGEKSEKIKPELIEDGSSFSPDDRIRVPKDETSSSEKNESTTENADLQLIPTENVASTAHPKDDRKVISTPHSAYDHSRPFETTPDDLERSDRDALVVSQQHQVPIIHRPPPPSMLRQQSSPSDPAPIIEARLVGDDPTSPIFDAIAVRNEDIEDYERFQPWWKRNQRLIFATVVVLIAALIAILGASLLSQNGGNPDIDPASIDSSTELDSSSSPTSGPSVGVPTSRPTEGSKETSTTAPSPISYTEQRTKNPTEVPTMKPVTRSPARNPTHTPTQSPLHIPATNLTEGPTQGPSHLPSSSPTPNPTKRPTSAMQTINRLSGKNSLRDPFSPQFRAAEWIVDRDPLAMRYDDPRFVQRYVLAVFYYATDGGSWRNRFGWMSSKHECEWYGIDGASAGCGLEAESVGGCNRGDDGAGEYDRICRIGMGNGNNLYGQLPSELGYLSGMRFFQVQNDYLIGTVPGELGTSWTKLNTLLLGGNFLEGTFPETFGGNEMLGTVFVDRNKFRGTFPSLFGMLENLEWLDAEGNDFEGELPATMADLKSLSEFFSYACVFELCSNTPVLPSSLVPVSPLPIHIYIGCMIGFLNVNNNSLSGPLPDGWDESNILEDLKISTNRFSGSLPASLGKVGSLKDLHASRNNISGIYPESYAALQNLKELYIDGNRLSGRFPVEYFESSEVIEVLSLHNNQLTGTITDSLCAQRASSLTELTADCGLILCECCTCYEDGNLVSVFSSGDTSPTTSPVAVEGPPLEAIESISRPTRAPVSPVPDRDELAIRHHIESTVLQRNAVFDAMETDDPRSIALDWILHVDPRQLTINDSNLSQRYILALVAFSLDSLAWYVCGGRNTNGEESTVEDCQVYNWESGNVEVHKIWLTGADECLWYGVICSSDGVVRKLELMANDLIGELPPEIGQLYSLQYLAFPGNCLYGTLPRELGSMQELLGLELHGNGMSGPFPQELYNMSQLVLLNLAMQYQSNNQCYRSNGDVVNTAYAKGEAANGPNYGFSGRILGPDVALWVSLKGLYLFDNSFSGTIATEIGDLENLEFLRANNNIFTGVIPESLVKLTNLKQLDLSKNELWSDLPGEIGLMTNLEILRVNENEMFGTLPDSIYDLGNLTQLWLQDTLKCEQIDSLWQCVVDSAVGFEGSLRTEIGNLSKLSHLLLNNNPLEGTLPTELGLCEDLSILHIHKTDIEGSVPDEVCLLRDKSLNSESVGVFYADCLPDSSMGEPFISCDCCTDCCDHTTQVCIAED
ncbi:hypothetical protein ACHAWF_014424 [Thalassiosira exigua]